MVNKIMQKLTSKKTNFHIKNIYVENYGCAANSHDLEIILGYLQINGYGIQQSIHKPDLIIINSCGVKKPTEDKILFRLKTLSYLKKPIIVAGCLPKINSSAIKLILPNYAAILGPQSIDRLIEAIELIEEGHHHINFFSNKSIMKIGLPEKRLNKFVKIIPVAEGCLGKCSYCCTKVARGQLFSFPITLIINEIKKAIIEGSIEIWLTGQDTGAYGRDIGIKLTDLLNKIIKIDKNFKIRVGMMNPNHMNDMIDELPSIYTNKKIYDFLHLPIQSGSDYVLKSMGRSYSTNEVKSIIGKFKNLLPNIVISTDIIVGFPTESEDDFKNSIKFVKDVKPDIVNISKFAPRPKTLASKLVQIPSTIIKDRSKQLSIICSEITKKGNKQYIDKKVEIIITKEIKPDLYEGRIQNYKKVLVNSKLNLLGKKIYGKIINSTQRYLEGEVVRSINSSQK